MMRSGWVGDCLRQIPALFFWHRNGKLIHNPANSFHAGMSLSRGQNLDIFSFHCEHQFPGHGLLIVVDKHHLVFPFRSSVYREPLTAGNFRTRFVISTEFKIDAKWLEYAHHLLLGFRIEP